MIIMKNLKRFNENQEYHQKVTTDSGKKQMIFGLPNGSSYRSKLEELNRLLSEGWMINTVSKMEGNRDYAGGLTYILEK
jgi:hypothetical protein